MPHRVLLVDDHATFRAAARALLEFDGGFEVVGEAADGPAAVRLAAERSPDVIVMDVEMPGAFGGVEATRQIVAAAATPGARRTPLVIGMSSDDRHADAMRGAGAAAFVSKARAVGLTDAIHAALAAPGRPAALAASTSGRSA